MAGHRTNLAVTKDGEAYNKLRRPDDAISQHVATCQAGERKRERATVDRCVAGPSSENKRTKTDHVAAAANVLQPSKSKQQTKSTGLISECGMRTTLPIDEEADSLHDSMGEALAYLRSVR